MSESGNDQDTAADQGITDDKLPEDLRPTEGEGDIEPGSLDLPDGAFTGDADRTGGKDEDSDAESGSASASDDDEG